MDFNETLATNFEQCLHQPDLPPKHRFLFEQAIKLLRDDFLERIIPTESLLEERRYYRRNMIFINEKRYTKQLLAKYNCTEPELFRRYRDGYIIEKAIKKSGKYLHRA